MSDGVDNASGSGGLTVVQSGIVQMFTIVNGQVDVNQPLMTLSGEKEFSRFGASVLVGSLIPAACGLTLSKLLRKILGRFLILGKYLAKH